MIYGWSILCQKSRATGIPLVVISSQKHHTPPSALMFLIGSGEPTLMLRKCAQTLQELSSYFHKRTEDLLFMYNY